MSALDVFNYAGQQIRVVTSDDEPWFVAADVAKMLGYSATAAMTRSLDDDERGVRTLHTPSGDQEMSVITEAGLFAAIIRSTVPGARSFKRWVTHDVLPSIRRTGSYNAAPALDISTPQGILALAEMAADTARKLITATEQVQELTPRAEAWDELASAEGDFEVGDAAKILARAGVDTGRQRLFSQLADMTWIYRGSQGKWTAYQSAVSAGYLAERPQSHHHPRTGELVLDPPQVRVTAKGLERLRQRLGKLDLTAPILTAVNA